MRNLCLYSVTQKRRDLEAEAVDNSCALLAANLDVDLRGATLARLQSESGDHNRKRALVDDDDDDGALKQDGGKKKKRGNLPKDAVEHLYAWLKEHWYLLARAVAHASARR